MSETPSLRPVACAALASAAAVAFVAFRVVTTRIGSVDAVVALVVGLRVLAAGAGLALPHRRAAAQALLASAVAQTLLGAVVAAALLHSAGAVAGTYAGFGDAVATGFVALALLVLPWAVVFPALELRALVRALRHAG